MIIQQRFRTVVSIRTVNENSYLGHAFVRNTMYKGRCSKAPGARPSASDLYFIVFFALGICYRGVQKVEPPGGRGLVSLPEGEG